MSNDIFNPDAEEAVNGSILINAESLEEVMGFLFPEDFFIKTNGLIYGAVLALHERRDPIDYLTVVNELEQSGKIKDVGGAGYILGLVNKTPSALNVEGYGRIVERLALRRRILDANSKIARAAHSDDMDEDEVISFSLQALTDATISHNKISAVSFDAMMGKEFHYQRRISENDGMLGLPTGLKDLDARLMGLHDDELIVFAAGPGVGKSAMLLLIALTTAKEGKPVMFFSLEMSERQIRQRAISQLTNIPHTKIKQGLMDDKEWKQFNELMGIAEGLPLLVDTTPSIGLAEMKRKIEREIFDRLRNGLPPLALIVIDYLQLITVPRSEQRHLDIGTISRELKAMAKEYGMPIVAGAQGSRAVETRADKRPLMSDLAEGAGIERAADKVIFITRKVLTDPDTLEPNRVDLYIIKNRDDEGGWVQCYFNGPRMLFTDSNLIEFDEIP